MPTCCRMLLDGEACYHATARGNQKQEVFLVDEDYETYLNILKHYKKKYHFWVYSYCPMPNHGHLLIEPNNSYGSLSKIMQGDKFDL